MEAMEKTAEMAEILAQAGDIEAQAMAKIYRADFQLLADWASAFKEYDEAIDLLLEAEVPVERIAHFFSRPQLLPLSRFYATLEEAIAHQDAEFHSWRPDSEDANHVAPFAAWNVSAPNVREPLSDNAFWDTSSDFYQFDLEFNIGSRGDVSAVEVLNDESGDRRVRRMALVSVAKQRFRPALVDGRRQRLRDVQMRFLIPRPNLTAP